VLFSEHYACPTVGFTVGELGATPYSLNAPIWGKNAGEL